MPPTNQPRTGRYYGREGAVLPPGQRYCRASQRYCRAEETSRERTQMRYYRGGREVLPLLERYYRHYNCD